jgi:hypothetical protein
MRYWSGTFTAIEYVPRAGCFRLRRTAGKGPLPMRLISLISALSLVALVAVACGGGSSTTPTPTSGESSSTTSTPTSGEQPRVAMPSASASTSPAPTSGESAESALRRQFDELNKGQFGKEWDELHPAQQAIISREHYIECGAKANLPTVDSADVIETYQEDVTIPGTSVKASSIALTVKLELSLGLLKNEATDTYHEVQVDGVWRWALAAPEGYANGNCPP